MRKLTHFAAVAVTALMVSAVAAAPAAAATNVLTYGNGTAVPVGTQLTADLAPGTTANFYSSTSGSTGVRCAASNFRATVDSNPTAPGVAEETLTEQTFGSCTSNVFGVTGVRSITVDNLPYAAAVSSSTGLVTISGNIRSTVGLNTLFGSITCVYEPPGGSLVGTTSDVDNSITFTNQRFDKVSGPSLCFSTAYFSAKYAPVTGPGGPVFVN
ncbi:MAG TPA: Tat pathway signal sequence domain protein [Micromonosporaceae bacterium]